MLACAPRLDSQLTRCVVSLSCDYLAILQCYANSQEEHVPNGENKWEGH